MRGLGRAADAGTRARVARGKIHARVELLIQLLDWSKKNFFRVSRIPVWPGFWLVELPFELG